MEDAPRTKRRRTIAYETPLVRSTEYWFHDGSIILQVESTQFRLAESMLAMHSSVFRDMFTVPLPADEPTIENCPVVVLQGDTVQDWVLFLGVLYPKGGAHGRPPRRDASSEQKYDFAAFRKDCLQLLRKQFPTTLKEFDKVSSDWTLIKYELKTSYRDLVSLAREIGLHSILPVLYAGMLLKGYTYVEMVNILDQNGGFSATDRLACLTGYANLLKQQLITTFAWLHFMEESSLTLPSETCKQQDECLAAVKTIISNFFLEWRPRVRAFAPWNDDWGDDLCLVCERKAKKVFKTGREECWRSLPEAFGLPKWDDLKALDFDIE
ncbi:hypothetical protein C8F04DRAFT_1393493 [Mycena alexandri]|uniref:BTB domain-containing protein n=1 Tax=Mycena alexandri TaxID=1745969 RepID=A0AAD6T1X2_9AGAR|nr:hypothetical protein C8F04DRAFT_1393493 [Mycena alexandri]